MLLYFFDLKARDAKAYNTLKRRFYYELKTSGISSAPWRTKSVLMVSDELEGEADAFFRQFEGLIEVYKARTSALESVVTE